MTISHNKLARFPTLLVALSLVLAGALFANAGRGEYGFGERTRPTTTIQITRKSAFSQSAPRQEESATTNHEQTRDNNDLVDDVLYGEDSMLVEEHHNEPEEATTPTIVPEKTISDYQRLRKAIAGDKSQNLEALENLLKSGVSANAVKDDDTGHTILHYAVWDDRRPEVVAVLLKYGADPNATRKDGISVLQFCFAKDRDNAKLAELLCDYGANVNQETSDGTLLSSALKMNKPKVGRVLRTYGGRLTKTYPNADLPIWKMIMRSSQTKSPTAAKNNDAEEDDSSDDALNYALKGTIFDLKRGANGMSLATAESNSENRKRRNEQLHSALRITAGGSNGGAQGKLYKMNHFSQTTSSSGRWSLIELKKRWYAAPTTLYTTSIFIVDKNNGNALDAKRATEAFADENGKIPFVAPGWLCYYEGWFSVPESGMYRFVGMGDDAMAVGVDKKTVLYAFWPMEGHGPAVNYVQGWEPENFCGANGNDGRTMLRNAGQRRTLYKGSWLRLNAGRRYYIQVVFGEASGGLAGATLGIQKQGRDTDSDFPLFTLEKMEPNRYLKISETGMYNTSSVFRAVR